MQTEDTWAAPHESYDYIRRLFNTLDRTFVVEYKSLWATLSDNFYDDICTRLDQFAASDEAAMASRLRDADAPTIAEEVEAAKRWFARRKEWLDSAAATLWVHLTDIEKHQRHRHCTPRIRLARPSRQQPAPWHRRQQGAKSMEKVNIRHENATFHRFLAKKIKRKTPLSQYFRTFVAR